MNRLTFISNRICPFAQRVWIALEEKNLEYELRQVDLFDKEPYFTETYKKSLGHDPKSNGKVPILIDGEVIITQSDLTSYYLIEKYESSGNQDLIPKDPIQRFKMRQFINKFDKLIKNFYGFIGFKNKSPEEQEKLLKKSEQIFQELNASVVLPYALGESFTMADLMIYPWVQRWPAIEAKTNRSRSKEWKKLQEWASNVRNRQTVKKTLMPVEYYIERYSKYF